MTRISEGAALVEEDAVDLALVYTPVEDDELDVHVDTRQPFDLIIPANHALAGHHDAVPVYALRNKSLVLVHNSTGMGRLATTAAQLGRTELRPRLRTNSVAVLINFVKSGIGVAFMPKLTVSHEIETGHIRCLPLVHPALCNAHARIVSYKDRELTAVATACLEHLCRGTRFFSGDAPELSQH